jgi:hypothetical protein
MLVGGLTFYGVKRIEEFFLQAKVVTPQYFDIAIFEFLKDRKRAICLATKSENYMKLCSA